MSSPVYTNYFRKKFASTEAGVLLPISRLPENTMNNLVEGLVHWLQCRFRGSNDPLSVVTDPAGEFVLTHCRNSEAASEAFRKGALVKFSGSQMRATIVIANTVLTESDVTRLKEAMEEAARQYIREYSINTTDQGY